MCSYFRKEIGRRFKGVVKYSFLSAIGALSDRCATAHANRADWGATHCCAPKLNRAFLDTNPCLMLMADGTRPLAENTY